MICVIHNYKGLKILKVNTKHWTQFVGYVYKLPNSAWNKCLF